MDFLTTFFNYYDRFINPLQGNWQFFISVAILVLFCFALVQIFIHGRFIIIILACVLIPGLWPAVKHIGLAIWQIIKFVFLRAIIF